jgi:hypothetical protein
VGYTRTLNQLSKTMNTHFFLFRCLEIALLAWLLPTAHVFAQSQRNSPALLTTFKNPTKPAFTGFGTAITPVGNDRLLISAPGAHDSSGLQTGAAYLVDTNGTLLTIISNPTPALYDAFGGSMTTVGSDRLLIGDPSDTTAGPGAGAAYLFDTNGTLLTTFTTPGASGFGAATAALGNDQVLIGAPDSGGVYLFNTNGTLMNSFTGPYPNGSFGVQVAAMGTDRFVVSAPDDQPGSSAGSAYLFSVDGTLLTTFTNPVPQDYDGFGWAMAIVGTDRVLIGAYEVYPGAVPDAGVAYLFNTNGVLLATFHNPAPIDFDNFGRVVGAVADKILIAANGNASGLEDSGIVCVFATNGTLLTTITNPTPESYDGFGVGGWSLPALGNNRVAIEALQDKSRGYEAGAVYLFTTDGGLLKTIFNPIPKPATLFGSATAAMGIDRVLVGAPDESIADAIHGTRTNVGAAYLLSADGTLLSAFSNPTPAFDDHFGTSIAALGTDRVVIGSSKLNTNDNQVAGEAYLFNTNGTLLTTFTNPFPAGGPQFGLSVAGIAGDRVLIGAPYSSAVSPGAGAVFLFGTNGALITTLINPAPQASAGFGWRVATLGNDRILVGEPYSDTGASQSGAAYLFDTNGTLLATFTNPVPRAEGNFGYSVATISSNQVLIGRYNFGLGTPDAGAVYLFDINGTLLTTFTNPVPSAYDQFGTSISAVGNNRVLIGAQAYSTNAISSVGVAYLFSTNGTLLAAFGNPTPENYDAFGISVAAVGNDRVLIGTPGDDAGAADSGAAYLFDIPYPTLSITKTGTAVSLQWVTPENGIILQQSAQLNPAVWSNTTDTLLVNGPTNQVQQTLTSSNRFFRLHRP